MGTDFAPLAAENLVQVFRARDAWQGTLLVGFLADHGIEATLRQPPLVPPFDYYEFFAFNDTIDGIFVFEHDAARARQLIAEFIATKTDEADLEHLAAQKPYPDREKIHWTRTALREMRGTFRLLGWLAVCFLVAGWLFVGAPLPVLGSSMLIGLVVVAWSVGSWLRQKS